MAAEAGAAGATALGVAAGAFGYNRGNYMYDAEFRWERFTSAREYANQQSEQYRGDIRNLAALTQKKNGMWATTTTLCMALCVALYCAGRLGLHGPSPPAWIMGLWLTNNAAAFAFMALGTFLALHAGFRAQASSVHLLTRKVRVPVPTHKQLDQARQFASEFEQQDWGDIFRIPYLQNSGAPKTDDAIYDEVQDAESPQGPQGSPQSRRGRRSSSAPPSRSKASSWVRAEFKTDRKGTEAPSEGPVDLAPEHFRLYKECQQEFYQHDIYARVCVFLGFIHYFQALCFYGLGHINIELRAFYVAYGCTFVIAVLMALVLRFDIVPASGSRKHYLPYCEYFGPLAVVPAAIGMSLDFRVEFDVSIIGITWVVIIIAYIMQLVYSLRILEVVLPDEKFAGLGERLGASWLPEGFNKVPSAFYHVLYFVAPPSKLQPGQNDIVREVKEGGRGACSEVLGAEAAAAAADVDDYGAGDTRKAHTPGPAFAKQDGVNPWKLVAGIAAVMPGAWVFLIIGNIFDIAIGEQALVTAPHWSRPPMSRQSLPIHELGTPIGFPWASGAKPWIPEQMAWHEEKRHADEYDLRRRLTESSRPTRTVEELSQALKGLLDTIPAAGDAPVPPAVQHAVAWPGFFEPRVLACGAGDRIAALTPRGFGASAVLGSGDAPAAGGASFRLTGLTRAAPIVGASWGEHLLGKEGMLLVSKLGELLACPGRQPTAGGSWACNMASAHNLPAMLPPTGGAHLAAAAVAFVDGMLHAAMSSEQEPGMVSLFSHDGEAWLPIGDIRTAHQDTSSKISLSFEPSGDLLIATGAGQIIRRSLRSGAVVASSAHNVGGAWQGACGLRDEAGESRVVHLRLGGGDARMTEMDLQPEVLSMKIPLADGAFFQ